MPSLLGSCIAKGSFPSLGAWEVFAGPFGSCRTPGEDTRTKGDAQLVDAHVQHRALGTSPCHDAATCSAFHGAIFQTTLPSRSYKQTGTNSSLGNSVLPQHGTAPLHPPGDAPREAGEAKVTAEKKRLSLEEDQSWLPRGNFPVLIIIRKPIY